MKSNVRQNNLWLVVFFVVGAFAASFCFAVYRFQDRGDEVMETNHESDDRVRPSLFLTRVDEPSPNEQPPIAKPPVVKATPKNSAASVSEESDTTLAGFRQWAAEVNRKLANGSIAYRIRVLETRLAELMDMESKLFSSSESDPLKVAKRLEVFARVRSKWEHQLELANKFLAESSNH